MTARRAARGRAVEAVQESDGVPQCLKVGRCIEVWSDGTEAAEPLLIKTQSHVRRRFQTVRGWWLEQNRIGEKDGWQLISAGQAWSALYLMSTGRASQANTRLAESECTLADLPRLAEEAARLYALATGEAVPRRKRNTPATSRRKGAK